METTPKTTEEIRIKRNEYQREYNRKHPEYMEKQKAKLIEYHKAHKEEDRLYHQKYLAEHKEQIKQYYKIYNEKKVILKLFSQGINIVDAENKFFKFKRLMTDIDFKEYYLSLHN